MINIIIFIFVVSLSHKTKAITTTKNNKSYENNINLEAKCTPAILNYLVEQENELVKEYAFCNHMVPLKYKREEILDEKKDRHIGTFKLEEATIFAVV